MSEPRLSQEETETLRAAARLCRILSSVWLAHMLEDEPEVERLLALVTPSECDVASFSVGQIINRLEGLAPLGELAVASRKA